MIQEFKDCLKFSFPKSYSRYLEWQKERLPGKVARILASREPPRYCDNDTIFEELQKEYPQWWPDYRFDPYGVWSRGARRSVELMKIPELQKEGLSVLDLGCGDGMTAYCLGAYGYQPVLIDIDDWRDHRAKNIPFIRGDVCKGVPIKSEQFDLVVSFNTFEHLKDPREALRELARVCKDGGHLYVDFDPLYCSPLGLHAYCFTFPYPQFLFSPKFLEEKVRKLGVYDLGRKNFSLQPTNQWRFAQYKELWSGFGLEVVSMENERDYRHLKIVEKFPEAFSGRQLAVDDLVITRIAVLLRKTHVEVNLSVDQGRPILESNAELGREQDSLRDL
jgi:SAM-dependent methyltransferase